MRTHATTWSVLLALSLATGCADGNPGLLIFNVVGADDDCGYSTTNAAIGMGAYDVDGNPWGSGSYTIALRVGNQLRNLSNTGTLPVADPNSVAVQSLDIELRDFAGTTIALPGYVNPYRVPAGGGTVPSSDGSTAGEGVIAAEVISADYAAALDDAFLGGPAETGGAATILVSITAIGFTAGGAGLASPSFNFPIEICDGNCLDSCQYTDETRTEEVCLPSCTAGQDTFNLRCTVGCVPGG